MNDGIQFFIQKIVLLLRTFVDAVILNGNRVRQFIIGQEFAIPIKNITSGTGCDTLFSNQKGIIIQILLALYYLKHKNALQHYAKYKNHHYTERK